MKRLLLSLLLVCGLVSPSFAGTYGQFITFNLTDTYPSAKIYHYASGTTTLQNCWSDRSKSTTVAQPLVADANGIATAFCDGIYKFKVDTSADVTLYTWDTVNVVDQPLTGEGANLASAAAVTFGTDGDYFHITGTTTITSFSGTQPSVILIFDGALTLTHSANIVLRNAVNKVTVANDVMGFVNEGSGVWREIFRTGGGGTGLLTTKGDILSYSTEEIRVAVGSNGKILTADSTTTSGLDFGAGPLTTKGDLLTATAADTPVRVAVGSNGQAVVADSNLTNGFGWDVPALRSYLAGLTLSTAGSSATMSIAAGMATDDTAVKMMTLAAFTKTTASWTVGTGNGCIDTGAIANTTWYHWWLIYRPDTQVVDVLCSLSATAPTMPTNYTLKRRIGSGKTDGSAQWIAFTQTGDWFYWVTPTLDVDVTNQSTSAVNRTLNMPTGFKMLADIQLLYEDNDTSQLLYVRDPSATDSAPSATVAPIATISNPAGANEASIRFHIMTNTSAVITTRATEAGGTVRIVTMGWCDRRGRDD